MRTEPCVNDSYVTILAALVCLVFFVSGCFAQSVSNRGADLTVEESRIKAFLQNYTKTPNVPEDKTTRYYDAIVDLNGDGKEVIVYLTGPRWCGSGGCTALVLAPEASSYKVVTKLSVVQRPIRVLKAVTKGWRNLGVWVSGGGIQGGYEAVMTFNGKSYPINPSVPPAQRSSAKTDGTVVIPEEIKELKALFP